MQAQLDHFHQTYLSPTSGLLAQCRLLAEVPLPLYNRLVKGSGAPIRKLPPHQYIWGLIHQETGLLISTLHLAYFHAPMGGAEAGPQDILQWSYAYTRDDPKYRRQGCSLALRLASMLWACSEGWSYLNSVPLPGAHSRGLLVSLGFSLYQKGETIYYYSKIPSRDVLERQIQERLSKKLEKEEINSYQKSQR